MTSDSKPQSKKEKQTSINKYRQNIQTKHFCYLDKITFLNAKTNACTIICTTKLKTILLDQWLQKVFHKLSFNIKRNLLFFAPEKNTRWKSNKSKITHNKKKKSTNSIRTIFLSMFLKRII